MLVLILGFVDACQRGYNWECTDEQMNLACEVRDEAKVRSKNGGARV